MTFVHRLRRPLLAPEPDMRRLMLAFFAATLVNIVMLWVLERKPKPFPDLLRKQAPVIMVTLERTPPLVEPDPPPQKTIEKTVQPKLKPKPKPLKRRTIRTEKPQPRTRLKDTIPPARLLKAPSKPKNPPKQKTKAPPVKKTPPAVEEFIPPSRLRQPPSKPRPAVLDKKALARDKSIMPAPTVSQDAEETRALEQPSPQDIPSPLVQAPHPQAKPGEATQPFRAHTPVPSAQPLPATPSVKKQDKAAENSPAQAPDVLASPAAPKTAEEAKHAVTQKQSGLKRLLQQPLAPRASGRRGGGRPSSAGPGGGTGQGGVYVRGTLAKGKSGGLGGVVYDVDCRTPERRHTGCPPLVKRPGEQDKDGWQNWEAPSDAQGLDARYQGLEGEALDRALGNPVAGDPIVLIPGLLAVSGPTVDAMRGVNKVSTTTNPAHKTPRIGQQDNTPPSITAPDPNFKE